LCHSRANGYNPCGGIYHLARRSTAGSFQGEFMLFKKRVETDDEFVIKIRRRVKNFRKIAFAQFVLSLVLLAASLFFLFVIYSGTQPKAMEYRKGGSMYIGFALGAIAGAFFAFAIQMAVSNFIDAVSNFKGRKEYTLLLKYYDQLIRPEKIKNEKGRLMICF